MENVLFQTIRDGSNGVIQNAINHVEFLKGAEESKMNLDIYFCFLIKTMVDDFGTMLSKATKGSANKEQFEAMFIENLKDMLGEKTTTK